MINTIVMIKYKTLINKIKKKTYSPGKEFVVYEISMQVFPTDLKSDKMSK